MIFLLLSVNFWNKGPAPDTSWNMELLATWADGDTAVIYDVTAYQNYIYLAHNRKGVTILVMWDSAGKTVVRQVGRIDSGRVRSFVAVRDSLLYCGCDGLLKIYSLANPADPKLVGMDSGSVYYSPDNTAFYEGFLFVEAGQVQIRYRSSRYLTPLIPTWCVKLRLLLVAPSAPSPSRIPPTAIIPRFSWGTTSRPTTRPG